LEKQQVFLSYTADTRTLSAVTTNYTSETSSWGSFGQIQSIYMHY